MIRTQNYTTTALIAFSFSALGTFAVSAADYPDDMRGSFPSDWSSSEMTSPLSFEAGLRYFYTRGEQTHTISGNTYSSSDQGHILEGHVRIDDSLTDSYAKGRAGISIQMDGTTATPSGAGTIDSGQIAYIGGDFGYLPLKLGPVQMGGFIGYEYITEDMNVGPAAYQGSSGIGASDNRLEIHSFKIGVAAKANISDMVDVSAEAAFIPFAYLNGGYLQGSNGSIAGNLYGGTAEVMIGYHPTTNAVVRVGGRASYMEGQTTVDASTVSDKFGAFRYGLLAELSYKF